MGLVEMRISWLEHPRSYIYTYTHTLVYVYVESVICFNPSTMKKCYPAVWSGVLNTHLEFFHYFVECTIPCCLSSALEFLSTCKLANLTVRAELGCCLLHRSGRLTIDGCILQCESNPLDHLSHAIVTTASSSVVSSVLKNCGDCVSVSRTRIEGGAKAVLTSGTLSLQRVRVMCTRASLIFWFNVEHR